MFDLINPRSGNYVTIAIGGLPLTVTGQVITQAGGNTIVLALTDGKQVSIDANKIAFFY